MFRRERHRAVLFLVLSVSGEVLRARFGKIGSSWWLPVEGINERRAGRVGWYG